MQKFTHFFLYILQENNNFPRTPCQSLTDPQGSADHSSGNTALGYSAIGLTFITAALAAYPLFYNVSCRPIDKKPIYKPAMQNFKSFWGSRTPLKLEEIGREG